MTPMIDVVFLLADLLRHDHAAHGYFCPPRSLHSFVRRPPREKPKDPPSLIRIGVYGDRFTFDDSQISFARMDIYLGALARHGSTQSVIILCSADSRHGNLVEALNLCAKHGLTNLSVVSGE